MMKRSFDLLKKGRLPSFVHPSRIAVLLRTVNFLKTHLWSLGVLYIPLLLSDFAHNSFLSSHFAHSLFGVDSLKLPITVSPVVSSFIVQTSRFAKTTVACTATEPCQAHPALPPASGETLKRLGTDEYFNVVVDLCSHDQTVEIEERDLLERSYEDYLEGSESVIVKGRLRVNVDSWESIGAFHFILSVIKEGYKIPFYYTPTPVILHNNKSALQNSDFVLSAITELLKVGSVWSVLFRRWLLIPCQFPFNPTGRKGLY